MLAGSMSPIVIRDPSPIPPTRARADHRWWGSEAGGRTARAFDAPEPGRRNDKGRPVMEPNTVWFTIVFVLFAGFAVLDAFDLGVGSLQFLWRTDSERRRAIDTVRPVWDGHELWLLAAGAALFVAFPPVFRFVIGAFGALLAVALLAFIARAVSIDACVRSCAADEQRRANWDIVVASALPPFLLGVALGNVMRGLPLDAAGRYDGNFLTLFNPYALLIGVLTVLLFAMHGALYLESRTEGSMRERLQKWILPLWCVFAVFHVVAAAATAWWSSHLFVGVLMRPAFWVLAALWLVGMIAVPVLVTMKNFKLASVGSAATIAAMVGLVGVALFPRLVPSFGIGTGLTLDNAAAAPDAWRTVTVIGLIVIPMIAAVAASIYRASRCGKLTTIA
jgi:cytochrome d ubiquinol oxidase subunit II